MLADELFTLRSLENCVLVNNNLCGKLISSSELPITADQRFNVISVPFFIPDFNLLSCDLTILHLKYYMSYFMLISN